MRRRSKMILDTDFDSCYNSIDSQWTKEAVEWFAKTLTAVEGPVKFLQGAIELESELESELEVDIQTLTEWLKSNSENCLMSASLEASVQEIGIQENQTPIGDP